MRPSNTRILVLVIVCLRCREEMMGVLVKSIIIVGVEILE